ncbi:MAG TPA: Ku protein [Alphaproteobacteria bacterium]
MPQNARAYWKGNIRLSLVTFPVELFVGVSDSQKIKLHKLSKKSGERIHYKDSTKSEGVVTKENIVKGYEYEKGQYVEIPDKELEKLKIESTHTIDLVRFTDMKEIDPIYFDKPYFVVPQGKLAQEAFITVRDALKESKKVALGQITIGGRERIAAIKPCGKGLLLETLRYNYEVRHASQYFEDISEKIKPDKDQIDLAQQLIKKKSGPFDPKTFKDSYQEGLLEIIHAKIGHRKAHLPKAAPKPDNVVNIMDALKRSLEESGGKKKSAKKVPAKKSATKKKAASRAHKKAA